MKRPNGTGSVYKDGRSWVAARTFYVDGDLVRKKKKGFKTKKEALLYLEELLQDKPKASIESLWETYLLTGYQNLSTEKQRHYLTVYERLKPIWKRDISSLSILDLQRLIEPYTSFYAQKDIKTVMSHLYNLAIAQQVCVVNLSEHMQLVKHEDKKRTAWSLDEIQTFWDHYNSGDKMCGYILFMIYTGCMPGELREIHRSMVDYENHEINGAGLKTETRKKAAIVMADKIIPVVQDLFSDSLVLWSRPKQAFYDEYYECIARCGVRRLSPYTCRHTTATLLANSSNSLTTQKIMRHAQISTTTNYVHPSSEVLLEAVNKI